MSQRRTTQILEKGNTETFTFHDGVSAAGDGNILNLNQAHKTMILEIDSDVTSHNITFNAKLSSSDYKSIAGVRLDTLTTATSTSGKSELWQFDVTGLTSIKIDITALTAGGGTTTVIGKLVN